MNQNQEEFQKYEKVSDQLQIAKIFMQNMANKEKLLKMQNS